MTGRPGVVFDCNVLLQAAMREDGPAAACLRLIDANEITAYISRVTLKELRAVLQYPGVREKNLGLTDEHIGRFLDRLMFKTLFGQASAPSSRLPQGRAG